MYLKSARFARLSFTIRLACVKIIFIPNRTFLVRFGGISGVLHIAYQVEPWFIFIDHCHISHNTHCLPPKILHKYCFKFLLGQQHVPREIENNAYAKFWGQTRCIMGDVKVANIVFWRDAVEPKYPWREQTSLICSRSVPKRYDKIFTVPKFSQKSGYIYRSVEAMLARYEMQIMLTLSTTLLISSPSAFFHSFVESFIL